MSPSAANLDMGFAEQKTSANSAAMKPAQGAPLPDETKPAQGTPPPDEGLMSPSAAKPEKGLAAKKGSVTPAATKPGQPRRAAAESVIFGSAAKPVTSYAPRPEYPQEARSHRIAGSGVCVVSVDASGNVTSASMAQSTGSPLLDTSALRTVRTWKFKPGTVSKVSVPIEFTLEGDNR